jgi:hypothetical protein
LLGRSPFAAAARLRRSDNGSLDNGDAWFTRRVDLLIDLLKKMGGCLGYDFDPVELEREVYSPVAHGELETEQTIIRKGLVAMFKGERALPVEVSVASPPQAPAATPAPSSVPPAVGP